MTHNQPGTLWRDGYLSIPTQWKQAVNNSRANLFECLPCESATSAGWRVLSGLIAQNCTSAADLYADRYLPVSRSLSMVSSESGASQYATRAFPATSEALILTPNATARMQNLNLILRKLRTCNILRCTSRDLSSNKNADGQTLQHRSFLVV